MNTFHLECTITNFKQLLFTCHKNYDFFLYKVLKLFVVDFKQNSKLLGEIIGLF